MRKVALKMSVSVDGFVGGRNGEVDWIFKSLDEGATAWSVATLTARLMKRRVPVRSGARSGVPPCDGEDRATWASALHDMGAVSVTSQPDLAVPGAVETVRSWTALTVHSRARTLILLSGRGEEEAPRAAQAVPESGAAWTLLRASWCAQNFGTCFLLDAVLRGEVVLPVGRVQEPFLDVEAGAAVAVAALTDAGHIGQRYERAGLRLLTCAEAVAAIGTASGHTLRYGQVALAQCTARLEQHGRPADHGALAMFLFTTVPDGRNASVTTGVRRALGREPRDCADSARETATTGVWGTQR